jgi:putative oxidoreductase
MLNKLVKTNQDYALTVARLVLGVIFFIHGGQLMLGWFGGYGLTGSLDFFSQHLGIPTPFALLAICAEFFGGLMLILGVLGRVAALTIICTMAVAVAKVHLHFGLFMNWFGTQKGEGYEYHLLAIALGVVIALRGSGALSLDRLLARARGSVPVETDRLGTGAHAVTSRS